MGERGFGGDVMVKRISLLWNGEISLIDFFLMFGTIFGFSIGLVLNNTSAGLFGFICFYGMIKGWSYDME